MNPIDSPYVGRIVVLLTPVLAGLAGWVAQLAAEYLPGAPTLDDRELTAVFVAGVAAAGAAVFKWLENRGKHEQALAAGVAASPGVPATLTWNAKTNSYEVGGDKI